MSRLGTTGDLPTSKDLPSCHSLLPSRATSTLPSLRGGTVSCCALYGGWGHLATLGPAGFPKGQLQEERTPALEWARIGSHVHSAMYFVHDLGSPGCPSVKQVCFEG